MYGFSGVSAVVDSFETDEDSKVGRKPDPSNKPTPLRIQQSPCCSNRAAERPIWTGKLEALALRDIVSDISESFFGWGRKQALISPIDVDVFKVDQKTIDDVLSVRFAKTCSIIKPVLNRCSIRGNDRPGLPLLLRLQAGLAKAA